MFLSVVVHSGESGKNTTLLLVFAISVPIILLVAALVLWLYLQRYEKTLTIFEDVSLGGTIAFKFMQSLYHLGSLSKLRNLQSTLVVMDFQWTFSGHSVFRIREGLQVHVKCQYKIVGI